LNKIVSLSHLVTLCNVTKGAVWIGATIVIWKVSLGEFSEKKDLFGVAFASVSYALGRA